MKRILMLFFCFVIMLNGCNDNNKDKLTKDTAREKDIYTSIIDEADNSGAIVYGRYGEEKEICSVSLTGKKHIKIYEGDFEKAGGFGENIVFYSKYENERGIYLLNANEKTSDVLVDGYRLTQRPCFSKDGSSIAFYAYPKYDPKDSEQYGQRLYYMDLKEREPVRIKNVEGELKHISFIDNENIIYSKMVQDTGFFQIFKYSIKENIETRLINSGSNDVNPVSSPDGTKIAFLSDRYKNYNLFILNLKNNTIQELDVEDAVVGESVIWSPDGSRIAFVTLSGVAKYNVKLAGVGQKTIQSLGNGYLAAFSSSGKSLIYAAYELNNEIEPDKKQVIYKMNIEDGKIERVWDFLEKSVFSRSINMLYWTEPLV